MTIHLKTTKVTFVAFAECPLKGVAPAVKYQAMTVHSVELFFILLGLGLSLIKILPCLSLGRM